MADSSVPLRDLVNKSGYPLQIAIARHVNATTTRHGWKVLYEEHGWRDAQSGQQGFIDLALNFPALNAVILVECKRLQDTDWILIPKEGESDGRRVGKGYRSYMDTQGARRSGWRDLPLEPRSPIAEFCVMRKTGGTQTVEPVAAELVSATEALAAEEQRHLVAHKNKDARTYYAAIVTTAQLYLCNLDPSAISLKDGMIPEDATFRPVPFVRFTKQLSTIAAARVPLALRTCRLAGQTRLPNRRSGRFSSSRRASLSDFCSIFGRTSICSMRWSIPLKSPGALPT